MSFDEDGSGDLDNVEVQRLISDEFGIEMSDFEAGPGFGVC